MSSLSPDGKPMRALRALVDTDQGQPLTEQGVWQATRRPGTSTTVWHDALAALVKKGLAKRMGRRGGYEWYITDAGKALLEEEGSS